MYNLFGLSHTSSFFFSNLKIKPNFFFIIKPKCLQDTHILLQELDHLLHALVNTRLPGHQLAFGRIRLLVLLIDTSESLNFARPRLLVQALDVALFADVEGSVDEAFDEGKAGLFVQLAGQVTILLVGNRFVIFY